MSLETVMDKTRLAAFVDGELSPEDAAEVVMHLADYPQDQAYVDELMAANEALLQAFSAPMSEPVPEPIKQTIMGQSPSAKVIPFHRKPTVWAGSLALAASVAIVLIALPQTMTRDDGQLALKAGPVASGSVLANMLDSLPSGTPESFDPDHDVMILATLPVEGGFCREIEILDHAAEQVDFGIACREGDGWALAVTMSELLEATGTQDGFVAASGAEVMSLEPFLDRLGAGPAMDAAAEAEAIQGGWQP